MDPALLIFRACGKDRYKTQRNQINVLLQIELMATKGEKGTMIVNDREIRLDIGLSDGASLMRWQQGREGKEETRRKSEKAHFI